MEPTVLQTVFFLTSVVIFLSLCCTGTVLNVVLLVVFIKHPETRTPENVLLMSLGISDILYLLSIFLTIAASDYWGSTCLGLVYCRSFTIALNVCTVAAISLQRYWGLQQFRSRLPTDKVDYSSSWRILGAVWITAAILAAEEVLLPIPSSTSCLSSVLHGHTLYRLVVYAVIPSTLITVVYIASAFRVVQSVRQLSNVQSNATLKTLEERRRRSVKMILALAVVFIFTYLPIFGVRYLAECCLPLREQGNIWLMPFVLVAYLISTLNPIFNPIALCVANIQLRRLYKIYCCCPCCCRSPSALPGPVEI